MHSVHFYLMIREFAIIKAVVADILKSSREDVDKGILTYLPSLQVI